jgi:flagellar protein FliO/FliZ
MGPMTQSLISIGLFLAVLACVPFAVKWYKLRTGGPLPDEREKDRIVSVLPLGPHQKIVTIEVGQDGARTRLTLGVTAQSIACLHTAAVLPSGTIEP